jgi:hypothetical protein
MVSSKANSPALGAICGLVDGMQEPSKTNRITMMMRLTAPTSQQTITLFEVHIRLIRSARSFLESRTSRIGSPGLSPFPAICGS